MFCGITPIAARTPLGSRITSCPATMAVPLVGESALTVALNVTGWPPTEGFGADVTLVRVIIAALALLNGVGVALYLAAWLLIPEDGSDQPIAAAWIADWRARFRST